MERHTDEGTASRILDVAERLVQTRGFNDFSYADVATELGVAKPSLHYHFRSKAVLGDALVERYSERFFAALDEIAAQTDDPRERLERYVDLYRRVLAASRMCLCGILAAEYQTLPEAMRAAVLKFFARNEVWLADSLRRRSDDKQVQAREPLEDSARLIIDTLEGALMVARAQNDIEHFDRVAARLLRAIVEPARA